MPLLHGCLLTGELISKYPPAEPEALDGDPLEAAEKLSEVVIGIGIGIAIGGPIKIREDPLPGIRHGLCAGYCDVCCASSFFSEFRSSPSSL